MGVVLVGAHVIVEGGADGGVVHCDFRNGHGAGAALVVPGVQHQEDACLPVHVHPELVGPDLGGVAVPHGAHNVVACAAAVFQGALYNPQVFLRQKAKGPRLGEQAFPGAGDVGGVAPVTAMGVAVFVNGIPLCYPGPLLCQGAALFHLASGREPFGLVVILPHSCAVRVGFLGKVGVIGACERLVGDAGVQVCFNGVRQLLVKAWEHLCKADPGGGEIVHAVEHFVVDFLLGAFKGDRRAGFLQLHGKLHRGEELPGIFGTHIGRVGDHQIQGARSCAGDALLRQKGQVHGDGEALAAVGVLPGLGPVGQGVHGGAVVAGVLVGAVFPLEGEGVQKAVQRLAVGIVQIHVRLGLQGEDQRLLLLAESGLHRLAGKVGGGGIGPHKV